MWFVMQYLFNLKTFKHIMSFVTLYTLCSWFKILTSNIEGYTFIPARDQFQIVDSFETIAESSGLKHEKVPHI